MLLALSIISHQAAALGSNAYKVFEANGGTIGRIEGNDWCLPDPEKFVSSQHVRIQCRSRVFYLEDVSTNGTFLNAPDQQVSRAQPTALNDGDRIHIGDYEILVQLIDAEPAVPAAPQPAPPIAVAASNVDPLQALLGGGSSAAPSVSSPADDGIPQDWQATLFKRPTPAPQPAPPTAVAPPPQAPKPAAPVAAAPPAAAVGNAQSDAGINVLFTAMGLDPARIDPAAYEQIGKILRVVVEGLLQVLQARAEVKNNFRMAVTSIRPVENNPLKFSMNVDDALHNLFVKRNPGYVGPVEAFGEALQDVSHHQMAMIAGIRAAFDSMLGRFDPSQLEESYERKIKRTALLAMGMRSKYWDLYREQFEERTQDKEAGFQDLFGEEFAKAYHDRMQELGAAGRARKK